MTTCPICANEMGEVHGKGADRRECADCRVTWIAAAELERILPTIERRFLPVELERLRSECDTRRRDLTSAGETAARGPVYPPCPECGEAMNRRAFAEVSGIRANVCVRHGSLFFDDGFELAVEFIARGGEMLVGEARIQELMRQVASVSAEAREAREQGRLPERTPMPQIFFLG